MHSNQRQRGFTLVEIALVMGLIGMILLVSLPSLAQIGSSSLSVSAQHLGDTLSRARAEAIARRSVVRVGFVQRWEGHPDRACRQFTTWIWYAAEEDFVRNTEWSVLPEGIALERSVPTFVQTAAYALDDPTLVLGSAPEILFSHGEKETGPILHCFDFLPNGSARNGDGAASDRVVSLVLVDGYYEGDALIRTSPRDEDGRPLNWAQVNVDLLTGRVSVHRP